MKKPGGTQDCFTIPTETFAVVLREHGVPEEIVLEVLSHGHHNDVHRETLLEKYVYAVDELSGFITAVALVRPNKLLPR